MSDQPFGGEIRVAAIVEGHGEFNAARSLIERIGYELLGAEYVEVMQPPVRGKRARLARNIEGDLVKAVDFSARRLISASGGRAIPSLILVLLDADDDCPAELAPQMSQIAQTARADFRTSVVLAVKEYETWFVAASDSLSAYLDLGNEQVPTDPEGQRCGKAWIEKRFRGPKYSETVDQPKLTARMNLNTCRSRCPSFDKLCREIQAAMSAGEP